MTTKSISPNPAKSVFQDLETRWKEFSGRKGRGRKEEERREEQGHVQWQV